MKKYYFSLVASFVISEVCFIANSPVSYAVKGSEKSKSDFTTNSIRKKTKNSLQQRKNNKNLSRQELIYKTLNPCRGFTIWTSPEKSVTFSWPSYGKDHAYTNVSTTLPGAFEITVSPGMVNFNDYGKILFGLHSYNLSRLHPSYETSYNYKKLPENLLDASLCGERSVITFGKNSPLNLDVWYNDFERDVKDMGGQRILSIFEDEPSSPPIVSYANVLGHTLHKYDFKMVGSQKSLKDGKESTVWIKEFINNQSNPNQASNNWALEPSDDEFPAFHEAVGVFVRNKKGQVLGGAYGHMFFEAMNPHTYIDVFYMDESVRGTGLGRHVMSGMENLLKQYNLNLIELGTSDHQAPWFYEKIGYKKTMTYPRLLQDRGGKYLNGYNYLKKMDSFSVGYKAMELIDGSRNDPFKTDALRRLKVTIYYPSNDEKTQEPYGYEEEVFWKRELKEPLQSEDMTSEEFESATSEINGIKVFKTKNAAPAKGPFPVILFEHGFGVTSGSYQHMILDIVSHGYVVLAPSHTYIADTVIFDDGEKAFLKADRDALMFETAFLDTKFVLSKIDEIASTAPSMDLTKIGMMGHSLGGATTIRTTRINSRVKAGIGLDAPVHHNTYDYDGDERNSSTLDSYITLDYGSNFAKPFLHIFAGKPMCDPSTVGLATNNFKAIVKGTEHNSFGDHGFLKDHVKVFQKKKWNLGAGNANTLSYYPELNALIRGFFDKFLKAAQVDLMKLNSDFITIETKKN